MFGILKVNIDEDNVYSIESKKSKTDHNLTIVEVEAITNKQKQRKKEVISCNGEWDKYKETLNEELMKNENNTGYTHIEKAIKTAAKEVMDKRYIKGKKRIPGYNEEIKMAIKDMCSEWKKEKDETKKAILEESYNKRKRKVTNMMDVAEGDEIRKMIDKNGEEQMDFWKMMRKIRNTKQQTNKIRKADGEITDDLMEIMKEKKNYYEKLYSKQKQNPEEKINEDIKMEEIMAAMKRGII